MIFALLLLILFASICYFFFFNDESRHKVPVSDRNDLYHKLLRKTLGDKEKAQRLVELERARNPQASLEVLIKNAINRIDMHNK
jgi:hypothetical protein